MPTLQKLFVESFKAFEEREELPLAALTVVFGANGSGKSALCHVAVALRAALQPDIGAAPGVPLNIGSLSLGSSFFSLRHGDGSPTFSVGLELGDEEGGTSLQATIGQDPKSSRSHPRQRVNKWTLRHHKDPPVELRWSPPDSGYIKTGHGPLEVQFSGLLPRDLSGTVFPEALPLLRTPSVLRLAPSRHGTQGELGEHDPDPTLNVGVDGSRTNDVLSTLHAERERDILEVIRQKTQQVLDIELQVDELTIGQLTRFAIRGRRQGRTTLVPVDSLGTGLAHALPVIVQHVIATQAPSGITTPGLLITEEPEAHLHPASQAALADVIIETARAGTTRCLVETHSETFVLRVRRRVADGTLDPSDVAFLWIDDEGEVTRARHLPVLQDGNIPNWPDGWFDSALHEVRAIHQARRAR